MMILGTSTGEAHTTGVCQLSAARRADAACTGNLEPAGQDANCVHLVALCESPVSMDMRDGLNLLLWSPLRGLGPTASALPPSARASRLW